MRFTDKKRLDWLQRTYQGVSPAHDWHKGFKAGAGGIWAPTLRQSIDAAIRHKERPYEAVYTSSGVSTLGSWLDVESATKRKKKKRKKRK